MNKFLDLLEQKKLFEENTVGNSKNKMIDPNGIFYHVIQQTDNRSSLFSADAARHRDGLMKASCQKLGIEPIMNVVMPNHTHDVFLTDDVRKIGTLLRNTNRGTAVFIRKEKAARFNQKIGTVFASDPGYVVIKNREQFFDLIKYLYDNPAYLKERGEFVPYSCFDAWEKGYYKPYNIKLFEEIFGISIQDILSKCSLLTKEQFYQYSADHFKDTDKHSDEIFKRNVNVPWI